MQVKYSNNYVCNLSNSFVYLSIFFYLIAILIHLLLSLFLINRFKVLKSHCILSILQQFTLFKILKEVPANSYIPILAISLVSLTYFSINLLSSFGDLIIHSKAALPSEEKNIFIKSATNEHRSQKKIFAFLKLSKKYSIVYLLLSYAALIPFTIKFISIYRSNLFVTSSSKRLYRPLLFFIIIIALSPLIIFIANFIVINSNIKYKQSNYLISNNLNSIKTLDKTLDCLYNYFTAYSQLKKYIDEKEEDSQNIKYKNFINFIKDIAKQRNSDKQQLNIYFIEKISQNFECYLKITKKFLELPNKSALQKIQKKLNLKNICNKMLEEFSCIENNFWTYETGFYENILSQCNSKIFQKISFASQEISAALLHKLNRCEFMQCDYISEIKHSDCNELSVTITDIEENTAILCEIIKLFNEDLAQKIFTQHNESKKPMDENLKLKINLLVKNKDSNYIEIKSKQSNKDSLAANPTKNSQLNLYQSKLNEEANSSFDKNLKEYRKKNPNTRQFSLQQKQIAQKSNPQEIDSLIISDSNNKETQIENTTMPQKDKIKSTNCRTKEASNNSLSTNLKSTIEQNMSHVDEITEEELLHKATLSSFGKANNIILIILRKINAENTEIVRNINCIIQRISTYQEKLAISSNSSCILNNRVLNLISGLNTNKLDLLVKKIKQAILIVKIQNDSIDSILKNICEKNFDINNLIEKLKNKGYSVSLNEDSSDKFIIQLTSALHNLSNESLENLLFEKANKSIKATTINNCLPEEHKKKIKNLLESRKKNHIFFDLQQMQTLLNKIKLIESKKHFGDIVDLKEDKIFEYLDQVFVKALVKVNFEAELYKKAPPNQNDILNRMCALLYTKEENKYTKANKYITEPQELITNHYELLINLSPENEYLKKQKTIDDLIDYYKHQLETEDNKQKNIIPINKTISPVTTLNPFKSINAPFNNFFCKV